MQGLLADIQLLDCSLLVLGLQNAMGISENVLHRKVIHGSGGGVGGRGEDG